MSFNAASLKLMADKGLSAHDIAEIASANEGGDSAAEKRRAWDRERKREKRLSTGNSTGNPPDGVSYDRDILTFPSTELPNEASASLPVRQPLSEGMGCWNENAAPVGWPQVKTLSPNRSRLLGARLREHGLDGWKATIVRARSSPYLAGPDPPSWFTFPWLIKAENFLKVSEGNYDRRHVDSADPTSVAVARILSGAHG